MDKKKNIKNETVSSYIEKQNKLEDLNNEKLINKENINNNMPSKAQNYDLEEKWELILSKLELPSTRMLLSQQAELESISSKEIVIALSPNWANMIKSRKVIIENTVKKIFGEQIKLNFSSKKFNTKNLEGTQEKINPKINNQAQKEINHKKSDMPREFDHKESFNTSTKNLANFFNGEIIDIDD